MSDWETAQATLIRFVERIPFTGRDWDLKEQRAMLAWNPNDPTGWRCHDLLGEIAERKSPSRVRFEVAVRKILSLNLWPLGSVLEDRRSRRTGRAQVQRMRD